MKKVLMIGLLFTLSLVGTAHAKKAEPYPSCAKRIQVGVDRFKTENISVGWWNNDVALNSREVAVDELVNSGCFTVLEREEYSGAPAGVMNEKALARSEEGQKGSKAAKKHKMKIADVLVSYALTGANKNGSGFNAGGLGGSLGGFGGAGVSVKNSSLTLTCKVFDTSTSEILASSKVEAKDTGFGVDAGGGGFGGGAGGIGNIGYFKDSKVGKMMSEAIHQCTVNLAKVTGR